MDTKGYTVVTIEIDFGTPPEARSWSQAEPVLKAAIEELAPRMFSELSPGEDWLEIGWKRRVDFRNWVKQWLEDAARRDAEMPRTIVPLK